VLTDDELGVALHAALVSLVGNVEPSPRLVESVLGASRRGRVRRSLRSGRRWVAAVSVALASAVAAAVVLLGSGITPSFAVTRYSDGSVVVTRADLTGARGANARLRQLGVRAVVVPISSTCTTKTDLTYIGVAEHPEPRTRLIPSEIPVGTTVLLAASQIGPNKVELAIGRTSGTPPSCVAPGRTGPGISPPAGPAAPKP
jgi:hypothetical protein